MKARVPVSNKQRKRLEQEATLIVQRETEKQRNDIMRKFFKLMCLALNKNFQFGHNRLVVLIGEIAKLAEQSDSDIVFWEHADQVVIDRLKLPFDKDFTD